MKNRIIILGIDGLEYNLVEEWNLKFLKQEIYCKTDLSDFDIIVTPPIWGAMITGKINYEIIKLFNKRIKKERSIWWKIGMKLPRFIKILYWKHIYSKLDINPFDKTANYNIGKGTIFDFFKKTWNNGIPSYGRNVQTKEIRKITLESISKDVGAIIRFSRNEFKNDKEALLTALEKDYELIFWYTPILDRLGHHLFHKKLQIMNLYLEMNAFVGMVKKIADSTDIFYIISDHGMVLDSKTHRGIHSDYGFFSSNTGEVIKKPQDLFYLIKRRAEEMKKNNQKNT